MIVRDLGTMAYRQAWALQEEAHAAVVAGGEEQLLLVEHPPVITFGRRPVGQRHLLASPEQLAQRGVEVVASDRGGDVTFHGPGQVVAYPIVRLIDHRLSVGAYVRRLEDVIIATLAEFGLVGQKDEPAIGVWVSDAKICALGVRIRQGVSLHGVALNVDTDLGSFDLIVPCGLADRGVTSMRKLLGPATPAIQAVRQALTQQVVAAFSAEKQHGG
jgi:lipoyl(octanoyl) transferase